MVDAPCEIRQATQQERRGALDLALRELSPALRQRQIDGILREAPARGETFDGLWIAARGGRLVGAAWAQVQPGGSASIWLPQLAARESPALAGQMMQALGQGLPRQGVRIAQALLEVDHGPQAELLQSVGLAHVTDLLYLVSLEESFPADQPADELEFLPYTPLGHARLAQVVEQTYHGTLDCPQLNGVRDIEDVLSGYRAVGQFAPSRWLIVVNRGEDVGCLLLADHAELDQWELVYMGLVPEARGRGLGIEIVRYAQWLTRIEHRSRLVLAVDAANEPAIALYSEAGFVAWDRRSVFLRVI